MQKRGFTLVEVLLVVAIIGVVAAIILPAINHILPDKNAARAKKAYNTLTNVVESLMNDNDVYDGVLGKMPNGEDVTDSTYFCTQFADKVNTSGIISCSSTTGVSDQSVTYNGSSTFTTLDSKCPKKTDDFAFKTSDGIYWYGMYDTFTTQTINSSNIDTRYVVVCADTNPKDSNILPISFGVRRDGKIIIGKREQEYLEEDE